MRRPIAFFLLLTGLLARPVVLPNAGGAPEGTPRGPLSTREMQRLLQGFADQVYGRGFWNLGQERDCDHGHLLFVKGAARPVAILYHSQELTRRRGSGLDPRARNWLQWLPSGRVDDARLYLRRSYPDSAAWKWFRFHEIPRYERENTIVPEMLDPGLLGANIDRTTQWVFTSIGCGAGQSYLVRLPNRAPLCLEGRIE